MCSGNGKKKWFQKHGDSKLEKMVVIFATLLCLLVNDEDMDHWHHAVLVDVAAREEWWRFCRKAQQQGNREQSPQEPGAPDCVLNTSLIGLRWNCERNMHLGR